MEQFFTLLIIIVLFCTVAGALQVAVGIKRKTTLFIMVGSLLLLPAIVIVLLMLFR